MYVHVFSVLPSYRSGPGTAPAPVLYGALSKPYAGTESQNIRVTCVKPPYDLALFDNFIHLPKYERIKVS